MHCKLESLHAGVLHISNLGPTNGVMHTQGWGPLVNETKLATGDDCPVFRFLTSLYQERRQSGVV